MLSINQKKLVNSLKQKKFRTQHNAFVVEGVKMVKELLDSDFEIELLFATQNWKSNYKDKIEVNEKELASISSLTTPNEVIAVVKQKNTPSIDISEEFSIALETIQDPGNMGTIIRTADWFGINNIICSDGSVDIYNPKVIQATMGSFFRVNIVYTNLKEFFVANTNLKIYGALLDGDNVYNKQLNLKGTVLLMGNESKGISKELLPFVTNRIQIPSFGKAESLNVATATAIFCSEFKR